MKTKIDGHYKTEHGSTVCLTANGGKTECNFDWLEEPNACFDCVVNPYPEIDSDGSLLLHWSCEVCGGGGARLQRIEDSLHEAALRWYAAASFEERNRDAGRIAQHAIGESFGRHLLYCFPTETDSPRLGEEFVWIDDETEAQKTLYVVAADSQQVVAVECDPVYKAGCLTSDYGGASNTVTII